MYGVGREVGMTSGPTKAIKSAVLGRPMYEVAVKGKTSFNDVRDVARLFIEAALNAKQGAVALWGEGGGGDRGGVHADSGEGGPLS